MTVQIEPAGIALVAKIMSVMDVAFDPRFGEAWSAAQLSGSLSMPDTWAEIAADTPDVAAPAAGFALTRRVLTSAELLLVAVAPPWRGTGLGRKLIDASRRAARSRGAEEMFLEVRDGNLAAQRLYQACNFEIVGRRRNYYSGGTNERFDAITMRCILSGAADIT
jgi:[ribosomal protein S18]-alanine N-acetyltransferase